MAAASISVQSGYKLKTKSQALLPFKFTKGADGSTKLTCEIVIPPNAIGVKDNETPKPDDPKFWEYGEIEVMLNQNVGSGIAEIFLSSSGINVVNLNISVQLTATKPWQMTGKPWQMGGH